jgi:hypothetical protein
MLAEKTRNLSPPHRRVGVKIEKKVDEGGKGKESSTSLGESKNRRRRTHEELRGSENAQEPPPGYKRVVPEHDSCHN